MVKQKFIWLLAFIPVTIFTQSATKDLPDPDLTTAFYNIDDHLIGSFTNNYGLNHIISIAGTYGMVNGGVDWSYYDFMRDNKAIPRAGFSSVIVGGLVPWIVPAGGYFYGAASGNKELQLTSLALGQAGIISYFVTSGYKALTGRNGPETLDDDGTIEDYSTDFKFGIFTRGVFDGWPSGHTTTAVAMATVLTKLYPENTTIKYASIAYGAWITAGVSTNIHWLSDAVAGTLIGYSIGTSVGNGFKALMDGETQKADGFSFMVSANFINITYSF